MYPDRAPAPASTWTEAPFLRSVTTLSLFATRQAALVRRWASSLATDSVRAGVRERGHSRDHGDACLPIGIFFGHANLRAAKRPSKLLPVCRLGGRAPASDLERIGVCSALDSARTHCDVVEITVRHSQRAEARCPTTAGERAAGAAQHDTAHECGRWLPWGLPGGPTGRRGAAEDEPKPAASESHNRPSGEHEVKCLFSE